MGVLAVLTTVRVTATLATPVMLAGAVDAARTQEDLGTATARLALVLALAALADAGEDVLGAYCGSDITAWLRHRLLGRVLALGTQGRRRFPTGDVLSRLTESASGPAAFPVLLLTAAAALVTTAGALIALALIDWWLAVAFAAGVPPMIVALRVFVVQATEPFARYQRCQAAIATRLLDARQGIRTIRASGPTSARCRTCAGPVTRPGRRRGG
jgi:ATP-binding cassette subfamily B protein